MWYIQRSCVLYQFLAARKAMFSKNLEGTYLKAKLILMKTSHTTSTHGLSLTNDAAKNCTRRDPPGAAQIQLLYNPSYDLYRRILSSYSCAPSGVVIGAPVSHQISVSAATDQEVCASCRVIEDNLNACSCVLSGFDPCYWPFRAAS